MTILLYGVTALLLLLSFLRDRDKTKKALMKAWKAFENILPQFLVVILLVSLLLSLLDHDTILKIIGAESGWLGVVLAAIVGPSHSFPALSPSPPQHFCSMASWLYADWSLHLHTHDGGYCHASC